MQRRSAGRGLGAILFTDIVSSTAIAAEMGNSRWSELVSRHHRLIRREIRRFGGREQDTAGDGFFVAFERPVDAIRAAVAAAEAVRSLGIEIRAGVAFGQLEMVEGKVGGLIVNTAARVMSVAGPNEVLVPASVVEIVPGTGIAFAEHGTHRLKGLGGEIRLFTVTEVDGRAPPEPLEAEVGADRRREIVPERSRRAGFVAGGIAAAIVAAVGIWALTGNEPTEPEQPSTPSRFVVELVAETGVERRPIANPAPGRPELARLDTSMVAGQGAVWIEDPTAHAPTVLRVDPSHREIRPVVVRTGFGSWHLSLATAFDAVWVSTDHLIKINPATDEVTVVLRIPLPEGGSGGTALAVDRRHLWIGTSGGELLRVDPSGEVTAQRSVADGIQLIAANEDGVWVVDQFAGAILRIDPATLQEVAQVPFTGNVDEIAILGDHVWALDYRTGLLTRISIPEDRPNGQGSVPTGATSLVAGLDTVWIAHGDGTVTKVDPVTLQDSVFAQVEGSARALAVDEARGTIWVDVRSD